MALLASTFRSERFLPAWLENMAAQSLWPETELVVVANDPEPREQELLREFSNAHSQVRVLIVPRERLYRSWNRAIASSEAPLLGIANVDDLRTRTGLEAQVRALEHDERALFCYGRFSISKEFPPNPSRATLIPAPAFNQKDFTRGMFLGPFFVWRRTSVSATAYFDEQLKTGGDFDLAIRLALNGRGLCVDHHLGHYYDGGTGLSTGGEAQPIERTVIAVRYGIYDWIDPRWVPEAATYVIPRLLQPDGTWLPVSEVVPNYEQFMAERSLRWARRSRRVSLRTGLARLLRRGE